MDANLFYVFNLVIFVMMLLALRGRTDTEKQLVPFVGIVIAIFVMATVNTDSGLTNPTSPVWPALYLPLFGLILNAGAALRNVLG